MGRSVYYVIILLLKSWQFFFKLLAVEKEEEVSAPVFLVILLIFKQVEVGFLGTSCIPVNGFDPCTTFMIESTLKIKVFGFFSSPFITFSCKQPSRKNL